MKQALIGIFACCLLAAGCGKDNPTPTTNPTNPTNPNPTTPVDTNYVRFTVSGLTDITLNKTEEKILAVGLTHTGGKQEKVTLSTLDLPANVTATFETTSGIPSFATTLKLKSNNATPGTYPIKVKTVTERDSVKTFSLNLKINGSSPNLGCAEDIIGTFSQTHDCLGGGTSVSTTIESTGVPDQVIIKNLGGYPKGVIANLNCSNKTLTIPQQIFESFLIIGGGTFGSPDEIIINYSMTYQGAHSCSATLTR